MRIWKNIVVYLILLVIIGAAFSTYNLRTDKPTEIDIGTFVERINKNEVKSVAILDSKLTVTFTDDSQAITHKERGESLSELLTNYGVSPEAISGIKITVEQEGGFSYWMGVLLPIVLPVLILVGVIWFMLRQVQGANMRALSFGQSGARQYQKNDKDRVTFADVAGTKEAKEELMEVVEFLQNPKKFAALGAKIPKGVLLMGPPGTGKTLLARAVAGQANVPFFHISGSEFVEMFVGVGASITGDTPVVIRTENKTELLPIADFVDRYYREQEADIVKPLQGVQTLGFEAVKTKFRGINEHTEKKFFGGSAWKSVAGVYRHKINEIYEIHYLGGAIRTTGDHSIFVRERNRMVSKKASELKPGDVLVNLPFKVRSSFIPGWGTQHKIKSHNWSQGAVTKTLPVYEENMPLELAYSYVLNQTRTRPQHEVAAELGVSQATVGNWARGKHIPRVLSRRYFDLDLPERVTITPELCKLFGYYTAEGRCNNHLEFIFGAHEQKLHKDCTQLMHETFGLDAVLEDTDTNSTRIKYYSAPLGRFFERHCGTGSHAKHVPEFLWTAPREQFLAYLEGYTKGDGYMTNEGKLSATSVSQQLIRELAWLCAMHGIKTGTHKSVTPAGRVIKHKPLPETTSWKLIIGKTANPFIQVSHSPAQYKKPKITNIVRKPYAGYVYDLIGCENEAFFGGEKPILLHNSRVRDLFQRAKKNAPCIVFIDEIDAVGRQRGAGLGGSHDEREQTLNQILVEMDGFDPHVGLVVLAGTNRPDVLDPALLRPGRFDRRVVLDLPDIRDREDILKIHAKGKPLAENTNLREIAERTPGMAGADLANTLNEAAILAARRNKRRIEMSELREAVEKVLLGPERKSRVFSKHERQVTAFHEAGHALVAHSLPYADPVHKISIISRGPAVGYTLKLPTEDKHLRARREFIDDLAVMLGGFVAEKEIFGDVTTGASNDLEQATRLARRIITHYGMSEKLGPRTFGDREELIFLGRDIREQRNYSEKVAEDIDLEISSFINDALKTARSIIHKKRATIDKVVATLMEKETLEREEFVALCGPPASAGREPPAPQKPHGSGLESTDRPKRAPKTGVAVKLATP